MNLYLSGEGKTRDCGPRAAQAWWAGPPYRPSGCTHYNAVKQPSSAVNGKGPAYGPYKS